MSNEPKSSTVKVPDEVWLLKEAISRMMCLTLNQDEEKTLLKYRHHKPSDRKERFKIYRSIKRSAARKEEIFENMEGLEAAYKEYVDSVVEIASKRFPGYTRYAEDKLRRFVSEGELFKVYRLIDGGVSGIKRARRKSFLKDLGLAALVVALVAVELGVISLMLWVMPRNGFESCALSLLTLLYIRQAFHWQRTAELQFAAVYEMLNILCRDDQALSNAPSVRCRSNKLLNKIIDNQQWHLSLARVGALRYVLIHAVVFVSLLVTFARKMGL